MSANKRPSKKTSKKASKVLRDDRHSSDSKTAAGYTLGDTPSRRGAKKGTAKKAAAKKRGKKS